jgi:DNA repair protein RecN
VKNLAIIDEVEVDFSEHLNVLTGETGAGKSIIIGSINIALGGKVSADMIRKGADYALVELIFQLEEEAVLDKLKGLDISVSDDQIIISRKIMNGRSISKINGETVTNSILKEVAAVLMDIHGQHEHQSLIYKKKHLEIVDRYAKDEIGILKEKIAQAYEEYSITKKEFESAAVSEEERLREISFLEYEINEIESARLRKDEEGDLEQQHKRLSNANTILEGLSNVYEITGDSSLSISDNISRAVRVLNKLEDFDEEIHAFHLQLSDIENLLNDFNRELSDYMSDFNFDPVVFKEVDERLSYIHNLKSKYGNSIDEIFTYYNTIVDKLERYRDYDQYISDLKARIQKQEDQLEQYSSKLSKLRQKNAKQLSQKIYTALVDLNFLDVRFEIEFKKLERYTENGYDEAEFIISTNPGEDLKPLSKVASGGELSRIMLAIKSVLADHDAIDTLIFDEIDVGVSGRTAQKVSEKLSVIAKNHQVICITHLPQIAAMADEHYIIEKSSEADSTKTTIRRLNEDDASMEIARILGGAIITESVINSAKEMKELARNTKKY